MLDSIVFLSIDDVLESHLFQVETYGGDSGLRDAGLLESAIAQPQTSFGGEYLLLIVARHFSKSISVYRINANNSSADKRPVVSVPSRRLSARSRLVAWRARIFSSMVPRVMKR